MATHDDRDEREDDPGTSIVPYGTDGDEGDAKGTGPLLGPWALWLFLGAVATGWFPMVGAAMMGYGFARSKGEVPRDSRAMVPWLVGCLGVVAGMLLAGDDGVGLLSSMVVLGLSGAAAWTVRAKEGSFSSNAVVIAVASAAYITIDTIVALTAGMDPMALAAAQVQDALTEASRGYGLDVRVQMEQVMGLAQLLWPLPYVLLATILTALAHGFARIAEPRLRDGKPWPWVISAFDAPVWTMVVVVAAALCLAVAPITGPASQVVLIVGLNGLMVMRLVYMVQGFAVISWFLRTRRLGCVVRVVVLMVAIDLEVSFFVVSILGLVDFWANFRHLPGCGPVRRAGNSK